MNRYKSLISAEQPEYLFFNWLEVTRSPQSGMTNHYGCRMGEYHLSIMYQMNAWNGMVRQYTTGEVNQDFGKADEWWKMRDVLEEYYREKVLNEQI